MNWVFNPGKAVQMTPRCCELIANTPTGHRSDKGRVESKGLYFPHPLQRGMGRGWGHSPLSLAQITSRSAVGWAMHAALLWSAHPQNGVVLEAAGVGHCMSELSIRSVSDFFFFGTTGNHTLLFILL